MNGIFKSISVIFHPIFMPLFAVLLYFWKSPKFYPDELIKGKCLSIVILTIVLPVLIYFLLKTLRKVKSVYLKTSKERILPLIFNAVILLLILKRVLPLNQIIELYYFFIGVLISTMTCLILAFLGFKASIHMIATSGVFTFIVLIALHFSMNLNTSIAILAIISGAVATSRLHLKAHSPGELLMGLFVGSVSQLTSFVYWL